MLAALVACAPPAPSEGDYFPLGEGLRWRYSVVSEDRQGRQATGFTVDNLGQRPLPDGSVASERRNSLGNSYYFVSDAAGIYRVARRNEVQDTPQPDRDELRRFVLPTPIRAGTTWQVATHPFLIRRHFEGATEARTGKPIVMTYRIESTEASVQVPAGRFDRCVLAVGVHHMRLNVDPVNGYAEIPIVSKEWYCPGVGLVKFERTETIGPSKFYSGGSQRFELLERPG